MTVAWPAGPSSLRYTDDVGELAAIYEPGVNVVAVARTPSAGLVEDSRRAAAVAGFRRLFSVTALRAPEVATESLRGFPHLAEDVSFWVEALAELTGAVRIGVRLARLEAAMCPRFHVDRVTLRVVSTYAGRGTELLENEYVDRAWLGHAALGASDDLSGLVREPQRVRSAQPFDVVLLKGEGWPGNEGSGAVHRSPTASREAPRLVMTLDPLKR